MICGVLHFNITLFALVRDAAFEVADILHREEDACSICFDVIVGIWPLCICHINCVANYR